MIRRLVALWLAGFVGMTVACVIVACGFWMDARGDIVLGVLVIGWLLTTCLLYTPFNRWLGRNL